MTKLMTINDIREAHVDQFTFHTSRAACLSRLHKVLPYIFPTIMIFQSIIIFPSMSNTAKKQRGTSTACRLPDQPYWFWQIHITTQRNPSNKKGSQKRDLYCLSHPRSARLVTGPTSGESSSLFSLHVTRIRLAPEHYKHPNSIFVHA